MSNVPEFPGPEQFETVGDQPKTGPGPQAQIEFDDSEANVSYAESFHSRFRDEFLDMELFESLQSARRLTVSWLDDYNTVRPHSSLGYVPPVEFAARCRNSIRATPSFRPGSGDTLTRPS